MAMVTPDGVEIVLACPELAVGVVDGVWAMAAAELTLDADDAVPGITV